MATTYLYNTYHLTLNDTQMLWCHGAFLLVAKSTTEFAVIQTFCVLFRPIYIFPTTHPCVEIYKL